MTCVVNHTVHVAEYPAACFKLLLPKFTKDIFIYTQTHISILQGEMALQFSALLVNVVKPFPMSTVANRLACQLCASAAVSYRIN